MALAFWFLPVCRLLLSCSFLLPLLFFFSSPIATSPFFDIDLSMPSSSASPSGGPQMARLCVPPFSVPRFFSSSLPSRAQKDPVHPSRRPAPVGLRHASPLPAYQGVRSLVAVPPVSTSSRSIPKPVCVSPNSRLPVPRSSVAPATSPRSPASTTPRVPRRLPSSPSPTRLPVPCGTSSRFRGAEFLKRFFASHPLLAPAKSTRSVPRRGGTLSFGHSSCRGSSGHILSFFYSSSCGYDRVPPFLCSPFPPCGFGHAHSFLSSSSSCGSGHVLSFACSSFLCGFGHSLSSCGSGHVRSFISSPIVSGFGHPFSLCGFGHVHSFGASWHFPPLSCAPSGHVHSFQ
ncbi:hypothetical protein ASPCADRAFT_406957 [Aspergillus carbonarius ITEM 5010]|uniref:Uncharacterized protein n=1 Tax=Aspergillus carbonarius (strain ITEM 5010) TaxID=602072 RepID=A0A1R3RI74_ASPC5|nr:hypothetical protein ASPCADRAFT_406957 [Aspergillus carbonarius ITEM 5010]